jgi:hypothetical protein
MHVRSVAIAVACSSAFLFKRKASITVPNFCDFQFESLRCVADFF